MGSEVRLIAFRVAWLVALLDGALLGRARAEDNRFIGLPIGGNAGWNSGANWSAGDLPSASDTALLVNNDTFDRTVTLDLSPSINILRIGNGGGGVNTLVQAGFNITTPDEIVGVGSDNGLALPNSRAVHVQNGGTNTITRLVLADHSSLAPSSGTYVLNAGALFLQALTTGYEGTGTFEQNGGSAIIMSSSRIGYAKGSKGTYILNAGVLNTEGTMYLGYAGAGTFIQSGGTHTVNGIFSVGMDSSRGAAGTYIMNGTGAMLVSSSELLGRHSPGFFIQSAGNHTTQSSVLGYINDATYTMSGGSLNVSGDLTLGLYGRGSFELLSELASVNVKGTEYVGYNGRGSFYQSAGMNSIDGRLDIGGVPLNGSASDYRMEGGSLKAGTDVLVGVFGPGLFTQSGGEFSTPLLTVGSGGTANWSGGSMEVGNLSIGGHMTLAAGSGRSLEVNSLKIDPFATHALDLTDNAAAIHYSGQSPLATIQQYLIDSRLFSSAAIPDVTGLGYSDDGSTVLVKYAYMGDSNLDWSVDLADFDNFLEGYAPSEASAEWINGNYDYNGVVNLTDFELYLNGYYALGGSMQTISDAVKSSGLPESDQSAMLLLVATVPEPLGVLSASILVPWSLFGRPHRRLRRPCRHSDIL